MHIRIIQSLNEIKASLWDALNTEHYPFTSHAYLYGLEKHDCLLPFGWQPFYFLLENNQQQLIAATMTYIKSNSYGELVFDHAWSEAFHRSGLEYYPKLVTTIPYTPATGQRFLIAKGITDHNNLIKLLTQNIIEFCQQIKLSSWHILFNKLVIKDALEDLDFTTRVDCQFHWKNDNYSNFDDFLNTLSSRKRKNIKKERRSVQQTDLIIKQREAKDLTESEMLRVHQLYAGIFKRKYGTATLSKAFFLSLRKHLGHQTLVFSAHDSNDQIIAISLLFKSDDTLFGRVWGCSEDIENLHFELCYYQGIEYCIQNKLQTFDPGAQGEHKISRGFLPTKTYSSHWIDDNHFKKLIRQFCKHEQELMDEHCSFLSKSSPYKK